MQEIQKTVETKVVGLDNIDHLSGVKCGKKNMVFHQHKSQASLVGFPTETTVSYRLHSRDPYNG